MSLLQEYRYALYELTLAADERLSYDLPDDWPRAREAVAAAKALLNKDAEESAALRVEGRAEQ